ncbi:MAG: ribbon-helix-helix domain-containing protein [Pseudomonadota bacterium]
MAEQPKPHLVKRSVTLGGHRTSVALEAIFWDEIDRIAMDREQSVSALINTIDRKRRAEQNLASSLRILVVESLRQG